MHVQGGPKGESVIHWLTDCRAEKWPAFSMINIISLSAANRSLDLTCLALADRAQKSIIMRFSWSLSEIL